ncbi:MAG: DNA polymerase III subunit gamma/tau [Candidatus Dormibacteria bacterium]
MNGSGSVRQTLYLKYRPQRFAELVGQEVVARTLRNSVREGRLSHAYLFTGIRGTGKTSAARILAKAINCEQPGDGEPCGECAACTSIAEQRSLDVIEIDAATNRGIDEIRDLRERAQFLPSQFKNKVYIIDEAHMLTLEAGNAFLKTLEEPPEHACFILATTEPQRLAETVRSRCQRFDFRRIPLPAMNTHLARICELEQVTATPEALALVAEAGAGSLRDALSLLDRLLGLAEGALDQEVVQSGLGMADPRALGRLAAELASGQLGTAWVELHQLQSTGVEPRQLARSLGALAKRHLWRELGDGSADPGLEPVPAAPGFWLELMASAAAAGSELRRADDPWMALEASLLRLCRSVPAASAAARPPHEAPAASPAPPADGTTGSMTPPAAERRAVPGVPPPPPGVEGAQPATPPQPAPAESLGIDLPPGGGGGEGAVGRWSEVLAWLGREHLPVQALLKEGRAVSLQDGVLTVEFDEKFAFHRGMMQSQPNRDLLQRACLEVLGEEVQVVVRAAAGEALPPAAAGDESANPPARSVLSQAMSVFPGSRVTRLGTAEKR